MENCCDTYLHYAPTGTKFRVVPTPFLKESPGPQLAPSHEGDYLQCPFCDLRFNEEEMGRGNTNDPEPKAGKDLCPDQVVTQPGVFAPVCAKLLMMVLYGARTLDVTYFVQFATSQNPFPSGLQTTMTNCTASSVT